jgi:hypothetical protein
MMEIIDLLRIGNLCLAGLAAGGMVMVAVAIIPARGSLPAARALELWQLTTPRIDLSLAPTIVASGVLALLSLLLGDLDGAPQRYMLSGLAATIVVAALSARFYESRAYRAIASWSPQSPSSVVGTRCTACARCSPSRRSPHTPPLRLRADRAGETMSTTPDVHSLGQARSG